MWGIDFVIRGPIATEMEQQTNNVAIITSLSFLTLLSALALSGHLNFSSTTATCQQGAISL